MFGKYDITFCRDESCPRTDCWRHRTKLAEIPKGIPVSVFLDSPRKGDECRMYYGDGKNENRRNPPV